MMDITFHGLERWTTAMFEKLGWMLLAAKNGHATRVAAYVESIDHLLRAIRDRKNEPSTDPDRRMDLDAMERNLSVLKGHVGRSPEFGAKTRRRTASKTMV